MTCSFTNPTCSFSKLCSIPLFLYRYPYSPTPPLPSAPTSLLGSRSVLHARHRYPVLPFLSFFMPAFSLNILQIRSQLIYSPLALIESSRTGYSGDQNSLWVVHFLSFEARWSFFSFFFFFLTRASIESSSSVMHLYTALQVKCGSGCIGIHIR